MTAEVAVRIAGLVLAVPFLLGLLPGSLAAVALGFGALGAARVVASPEDRIFPAAAILIFAADAAVGAARWGSLDLDFIRGAQAVLGPTVAVAPAQAAGAALAAAAASVVALGLWLGKFEPIELWRIEAVTGALLVVTVFFGPALSGLSAPGSLLRAVLWLFLTAGVAAAGGFVATRAIGRSRTFKWRVLIVVAAATVAAGVVLASAP